MKNVLVLFAHPRYEKSRINKALLNGLRDQRFITVHDLYEQYPDFNIDVAREQELLLGHEIIILQSPFFLYGAPAMIKQWSDLVLEHGWAHGQGGNNLVGKIVFAAITTGGTRSSYSPEGFNRYTIPELLRPLQQAAGLCRMNWLPPFVVQGTYCLPGGMLEDCASQYRQLIMALAQSPALDQIKTYELLNDWLEDSNRMIKP